MEATNHPAPVILSDEQVTRIERESESASPRDVRALCATVRAAWARIEKQDAIISAYENNDEEALAEAENL